MFAAAPHPAADANRYGPDTPRLLEQLGKVRDKWYQFSKRYTADLDDLRITSLPDTLPAYLKVIYMNNTTLPALPPLTTPLVKLFIRTAPLSMVHSFPDTLEEITLTDVRVSTLPPLPPRLKELWLNDIPTLTTLPPLPSTLRHLSLYRTNIQEIPPLPEGIQNLNLNDLPELRVIPTLPKSLLILYINNTSIEDLPALDRCTKLDAFHCSGANIKRLPPLPDSLASLHCNNTSIQEVPLLSNNLEYLSVNNTLIEDLDGDWVEGGPTILPPQIKYVYAQNTRVKVVPAVIAIRATRGLPGDYNFGGCPLLLKRGAGETDLGYMARWDEWHQKRSAMKKAKKRCAVIKEELMAAAWAPARVERWVEAGDENLLG
jgi:hypothetical protein